MDSKGGCAAPVDEDDSAGDHPLAVEEWLACRILECVANPRAVCRFALVNRNFCAASVSNPVWQKMLPSTALLDALLTEFDYKLLSKKFLYMYLCHPITYDKGLKKFWLDPATGGDCYMISARALQIACGGVLGAEESVKWETFPGSMFPEVAYLPSFNWFEVKGTFKQLLRPGRYTVSYRFQLLSRGGGWLGRCPIKLCIENTTYAHPPHESVVYFDSHNSAIRIRSCPLPMTTSQMPASLDNESLVDPWGSSGLGMQHPSAGSVSQVGEPSNLFKSFGAFMTSSLGRLRHIRPAQRPHDLAGKQLCGSHPREHDPGLIRGRGCCVVVDNVGNDEAPVWVECDVGEFSVEDDNEGPPVEVHFSMKEGEVLWWKGWFALDVVIIRPSYVALNFTPFST